MSRTILVTTGATASFDELVSFSLSEQFLEFSIDQNFQKLIIQYGANKSLITKQTHLKLQNSKSKSNTIQNCSEYSYKSLQIVTYSFNSELLSEISQVEFVISHAGTGSILDSLRLNKPLFVVVNEKLMDNHQLETAQAFENQNLICWDNLSNYDNALIKIEKIINGTILLKKMPDPVLVLTKVIEEELC